MLEIGCGKGDFLKASCTGRRIRGVGVDPCYRHYSGQNDTLTDIRFVQDAMENHPDLVAAADVIIFRHTLEHVADPVAFLRFIRAHLRAEAFLFFEVPDAVSILRRLAFWDIYYEHCSYYCEQSLSQVFTTAGFRIDELYTAFDDQYLIVEARPAMGSPNGANVPRNHDLESLTERFRASISESRTRLHTFLGDAHRAGRGIVVWGGGSKAVALLTTLEIQAEVNYLVDINPHKHNKYLPGTGHEILAPETLKTRPADVVVLMNPVYEDEVRCKLRSMGMDPELYCMT